jgi:hypothetical protein
MAALISCAAQFVLQAHTEQNQTNAQFAIIGAHLLSCVFVHLYLSRFVLSGQFGEPCGRNRRRDGHEHLPRHRRHGQPRRGGRSGASETSIHEARSFASLPLVVQSTQSGWGRLPASNGVEPVQKPTFCENLAVAFAFVSNLYARSHDGIDGRLVAIVFFG